MNRFAFVPWISLVAIGGGWAIARAPIAREACLNAWDLATVQAIEVDRAPRHRVADPECQQSMVRIRLKQLIAKNLIDRRISLAEAAREFVAINESDPKLLAHMRRCFPASSDEASAELQVLAFVCSRWKGDSSSSSRFN